MFFGLKISLSTLRIIAIGSMGGITAACSAIAVTCDYDKKAKFEKYYTYAFVNDLGKLPIKKFDKQCILQAIENEMELRGYRSLDTTGETTIDLLVDVQTKKSITASTAVKGTRSDTHYVPWGYEFSPGLTDSRLDLDAYKDDALFINVIENAQKKIIWQGRGTKAINERLPVAVREANINYAVGMIFRHYPVPSSRK
jgi:hypothetical protein